MTFRSEPMTHYQLIIQRQVGWQVANYLGSIEKIHLEDISNPNNKPFYSQVKRCQQSLQKVNSMIAFMKSKKMGFEEYIPELEPNFVKDLMHEWQVQARSQQTTPSKKLDAIEDEINKEWERFLDLTQRSDRLNTNLSQNKGKIAVFEAAKKILGANYFTNSKGSFDGSVSSLSYLIGIINPQDEQRISKMVFRVSRGYATVNIIKSADLGERILQGYPQNIIFVFFPTSEKNTLKKKLQRVIESMCLASIDLPETKEEFERQSVEMMRDYQSNKELGDIINNQTSQFIRHTGSIKRIEQWRIFLYKEKHLYESLNKMEIRDKFMYAHLYIPTEDIPLLGELTKISPTPIFNELKLGRAPSKFQINSFTFVGQEIVETYGIPRYGEINPGVYTCITFPFFFGVMFGDIGHGLVLFAFGLFLVMMADRLKTTGLKGVLPMRYMLALMGFFAVFSGFIYNDFLGMNLNLFGSCYPMPHEHEIHEETKVYPKPDCTYPLGLDPGWERASNDLAYINSFKMKLAVILGVIHMVFGIFLKAANCLYFKKMVDFYCEFIPQVIFMIVLFGYMDFLIVFKWLKHYPQDRVGQAPSIISTMINIPLKMGHCTDQLGGGNLWGPSWDNTSQTTVQQIILVIALLCIPMMLIPKPIIEIQKGKKHKTAEMIRSSEDMAEQLHVKEEEEVQHHDSGEIIVHQIIETIEFVLGGISNTASYLRLWALSLAHSQLSQVFFQKTVEGGLENGWASMPALIYGFYILAWFTFGVLMCMDTMECFLHALRLHWVEFQNKFYKADGIKFVPMSFRQKVIDGKEEIPGSVPQ